MILNVGGSHYVYHAGQHIAGPMSVEKLNEYLDSPRFKARVRELDEEDEENSRRVCQSFGGSSAVAAVAGAGLGALADDGAGSFTVLQGDDGAGGSTVLEFDT
jgi:hypothetical protein